MQNTAFMAHGLPLLLLFAITVSPTRAGAADDLEQGAPDHRVYSVVVLDVRPSGPVTDEQVGGLSAMLTSEVSLQSRLHVISSADVRELLDFEAQRQLLGCNDIACLTEIGGALGASHLLSSEVSRFGESWLFTLVLLDLKTAEPLGRLTVRAAREDEILDELRPAVRHVFQSLLTADDEPVPARRGGGDAEGYRLKVLGAGGVSVVRGDLVTATSLSWPGPEFWVGAGYDITPNLGVMVTGMAAQNDFNDDDWLTLGMVSLVANVTFLPDFWLRPYLRAGLGPAFVELDRNDPMPPIREVTIGIVGMAGAEFMISNQVGVFFQLSGRQTPSVTESGLPPSSTLGLTFGVFSGLWERN